MMIPPRFFPCLGVAGRKDSPAAAVRCGRGFGGFTLTEILAVLAIVAVCTALLPALSGSLQGSSLNTGARATMNLLTAARTEAITRRELVRFAVAADWLDSSATGYGKFCLWASATGEPGSWRQISRWEKLPAGILFDPAAAGYIESALRPSTDCILAESAEPVFSTSVGANEVTMKYVEFTPGGAIRKNGGSGHEIWFALSAARNASRPPSNWALLAANIHTGRFRCVRPGGQERNLCLMIPSSTSLARSRRHAFSLVEIAMALGIIAFAVLAILGLMQVGVVSLNHSVNDSMASLILSDVRSRLDGGTFPSDSDLAGGVKISLPPVFYDRSGRVLDLDTSGSMADARYRVEVVLGAPADVPPDARVAAALVTIAWPPDPADGSVPPHAHKRQLSFLVTPGTDHGWTAASPFYQARIGQ